MTHDATPPSPAAADATERAGPNTSRWFHRLPTIGLVLLVLAAAAWVGRPVWRRLDVVYVQKRCMTFALPPDRVVYEVESTAGWAEEGAPPAGTTPDWAAALLGQSGYRRATGPFRVDGTAAYQAVEFRYAPLRRFPTAPVGTADVSVPWPAGPCLFLHARRTRFQHVERLVVVDLLMTEHTTAGPTATFGIGGSAIIPATVRTDPQEVRHAAPPLVVYFDRPFHFRLFAGQPDPNDASRFTIAYEAWDVGAPQTVVRGTIDGGLRDDERVELRPREGRVDDEGRWSPLWPSAATQPATTSTSRAW